MKMPEMPTWVGLNYGVDFVLANRIVSNIAYRMNAHRVDLAHGGLESGQNRCQDNGSEGQRRFTIVAQGQQVLGRKLTRVDDDLGV